MCSHVLWPVWGRASSLSFFQSFLGLAKEDIPEWQRIYTIPIWVFFPYFALPIPGCFPYNVLLLLFFWLSLQHVSGSFQFSVSCCLQTYSKLFKEILNIVKILPWSQILRAQDFVCPPSLMLKTHACVNLMGALTFSFFNSPFFNCDL